MTIQSEGFEVPLSGGADVVASQNVATSREEVARWLANPPVKAFVYVKPYLSAPHQGNVTTWMGSPQLATTARRTLSPFQDET